MKEVLIFLGSIDFMACCGLAAYVITIIHGKKLSDYKDKIKELDNEVRGLKSDLTVLEDKVYNLK